MAGGRRPGPDPVRGDVRHPRPRDPGPGERPPDRMAQLARGLTAAGKYPSVNAANEEAP